MRRKKPWLFSFVVAAAIIASGSGILLYLNFLPHRYLSIDPIYIDNSSPNASWSIIVSTKVWCTGSGTSEDPYLIKNVRIDANFSGNCIEIKNSNVYFIIRNCILINSEDFRAGLLLNEVENGVIQDVRCENNYHGIELFHWCYYNLISGNMIINNRQNGIKLEAFNEANTITKNKIYNNDQHGVSLGLDSRFNTVSENIIEGHIYSAINIQGGSEYNTVVGNILRNNPWCGIWVFRSDHNTISENEVYDNGYDGIMISKGGHNIVKNNIVRNNYRYGIYLDSNGVTECHHNEVRGNLVENNQNRGIMVEFYCNNNSILRNSIIENSIQAQDNGGDNRWNDYYKGNYWSDYYGTDADDDNIGDDPYSILGTAGSADNFPLMNDPFSI
ncbi:MAG: right-handed parallel beta-helix repeat-containing protein [Promethearchaeota archaeon]